MRNQEIKRIIEENKSDDSYKEIIKNNKTKKSIKFSNH